MTFAHIPAELQALPQWVCWKLVARPGQPKPTKIPVNAIGPAKTKDGAGLPGSAAATWMTYADAVRVAAEKKLAGIGFVFTLKNDYVGIDLDAVVDDQGVMTDDARDIIGMFPGAYVELSQSKRGVHIIVRGALPAGARRKGQVEAYSDGRYFALTGNVFGAATDHIPAHQAAIDVFHAKYLHGGTADPVDQKTSLAAVLPETVTKLIEQAKAGSVGLSALFNFGETRPGKSASESDSWMACELAKYSRDPLVIVAAMKASGLARQRWNEARPNSPTGTLIGLAIADALRKVPDPADVAAAAAAGFRMLLESELAHEPEPPWLLPQKIAAGAMAVLYGPSESGKSFLALDWALQLAKDGKRVLYVAAEGWHGTKRRVRAWRAARGYSGPAPVAFMSGAVNLLDMTQVQVFKTVGTAKCGGPPDFYIIDTLNQNMPGGNENAPQDMSSVIAAVNALRLDGSAVLILHHPRKSDEVERGHSSLRNAADTMLKFTTDPADDHRVLECTKQKDAAPFKPERYALVAAEGTGSMVLEPREFGEGDATAQLSTKAVDTLEALKSVGPATNKEWMLAATAKGVAEATFNRVKKVLVERGIVVKEKARFRAATSEELTLTQQAAEAQPAY